MYNSNCVQNRFPDPGSLNGFEGVVVKWLRQWTCDLRIAGQMVNSDSEKCTFNADGAPNEDCRFLDDQTGTYLASLMYKQFLPQVQKFCDSPDYTFGDPAITHNAEAPNRQNIECASMSIWEVLRQHSDFRNVSDTFVGGFRPVNFQPTFRILKRRSSTAPLILVLDTSASMNDFQRLHTLRQVTIYDFK
ncbi:putative epithelial chloride channel protein-like [Apostichopus japonicus]|uniref:Putative epithelial chloride channel protein-like n=1 Tax=Stichopus japonicus TaxID=307972 RepID=A0A2G8LQ32_STIJA|nr:putative epithelial chloride channel protein-like [Apostichopus japonicus]